MTKWWWVLIPAESVKVGVKVEWYEFWNSYTNGLWFQAEKFNEQNTGYDYIDIFRY